MIIGLTGVFSSGKTTVAKMFKQKKALIIDADKLAHEVIKIKTLGWEKVVAHFGGVILQKNGQIDRKKLGAIVFKNKKELKWLVAVIHPVVISRIKALIKKYKKLFPDRIIIIDAPLLLEAGLNSLSDKLIVVKCSLATQISRAMSKTGLSGHEVLKRISSQLPIYQKAALADFVVDNDGSLVQTKKQVERIYQKLLRRR